MANEINTYERDKRYIYIQYRKLQGIEEYINVVEEFIKKNYYEFIKNDFIHTLDMRNTNSYYLEFYIKNYFGLFKPFGEPQLNRFYDAGEIYDGNKEEKIKPIIYDDFSKDDGKLNQKHYRIFLKFVLGYEHEIWTYPIMFQFISEWLGCDKREIKLEFPNEKTTIFKIPQKPDTLTLLQVFNWYRDRMGMPINNGWKFVLNNESFDFDNSGDYGSAGEIIEDLVLPEQSYTPRPRVKYPYDSDYELDVDAITKVKDYEAQNDIIQKNVLNNQIIETKEK